MLRCGILAFLLCFTWLTPAVHAADRPNVVWIVSEDNSIHFLQHFFPGGAPAPNIESMAAAGLTFDHAFSNAPVCSVARTTLATGCYGPRIGTQFHRRYVSPPMPEGLEMFPAYLRKAGYYTTNNSKKDYNAIEGPGVWDQSSRQASWRNRPTQSQPFFHMQSHADSHESRLHFPATDVDNVATTDEPSTIELADYHPDTKLFRYTYARYHDCIRTIDKIVGKTLADLKADGVLEDTFVFYFGDHGGVLPRGKGYLYESGLHVPLVVRVPKNFAHLVERNRGDRVGGFVSFVDFGPTVLSLAGVPVPNQVDGRPFLGSGVSSAEVDGRDTSFGYADRFDEKYDLVRSLRKGKYQYIRSFQPYLPDGLMNIYRYKCAAFKEWKQLFDAGQLDPTQAAFFRPKPIEQLYDCLTDPHQVNNLAGDPKHAAVLQSLRTALHQTMAGLPDLSLYPESHLAKQAMTNPTQFGADYKSAIAELLRIADLGLLPFTEAKEPLQKALSSADAMHRYWAATVCTGFGDAAKSLQEQVRPLLDDSSGMVRVRAAEFLGRVGAADPRPTLIDLVNTTDDAILATETLNSLVWLRDSFGDRYPIARNDFHPVAKGADVDDRLNYINGVPYPKAKKPKPSKRKR
ncbi:MAG: sulfatase-like hydrolase/transferase [Planctomycetota bacterium]